MSAMLALLGSSKLITYGIALVGALLAAIGAGTFLRHTGVQAQQDTDLKADAAARDKATKAAAQVAALGDSAVIVKLKADWGRK